TALAGAAARTQVWMVEMAKAVAVYPEPFWREQGLSGLVISHQGPFREIHDHSGPLGTPAALFGFAPSAAVAGADDAAIAEAFTRVSCAVKASAIAASSETATEYAGHVEGAIRAGLRAADAVARSLAGR